MNEDDLLHEKDLDSNIGDEDDFSDLRDDFDDTAYGDDFSVDSGAAIALEKHGDLLKSLTDFDPYIETTFYGWIGYSYDEKEQKWRRDPFKKPMMSLKGANYGIYIIRTYARNNNIITNIISEDYVYMIEDLLEVIYLNYGTRDDFGVKSDGDLMIICNQILHCCQLVLMGAGDGKYTDLLTSTTQRNESVVVNPGTGSPTPKPTPRESGFEKIRSALLGDQ